MRDNRTESDLAEALATLERYAPDPDTVLRGLRKRPRRRVAAWRRPPILSAAASAVAVALILALLVSARTGPPGRPAPPRSPQPPLPSAKSVATAMMTALGAVRGDVEYETQTGFNGGVVVDVYQSWSLAAQPVPGHRELSRMRYSGRSPHSAAVKLTEDRSIEYVARSGVLRNVPGQVTMVCFLGSGQTGCGFGHRNVLPGTWSRFTAPILSGSHVGPGELFDPSSLVHGIAVGAWRVVGRTQLDGQRAIELAETGRGQDSLKPLPVTLWVSARTYLPIRLAIGAGKSTGRTVDTFRFLPPTPASLALLQVPIPAGYPRR